MAENSENDKLKTSKGVGKKVEIATLRSPSRGHRADFGWNQIKTDSLSLNEIASHLGKVARQHPFEHVPPMVMDAQEHRHLLGIIQNRYCFLG